MTGVSDVVTNLSAPSYRERCLDFQCGTLAAPIVPSPGAAAPIEQEAMIPDAERVCPLCGSNRVAGLFRKEQTDYWRCRACGFRFATPPTNPNLANEIGDYEKAYLQYLEPDRADDRNFDELRGWIETFGSLEAARLLDVGAGSGKLVRYLLGRGVLASGLEPARPIFDMFLKSEPAFTCAMLGDYRSADGQPMDIVTVFDVLEHIADPASFLDDIAAQLKPGGLLFISTPDVGSLVARLFGRRWHFFSVYHLSFFSKRTLVEAAGARGFSLVDFRRRGRLRSVGYMVRYGAEFIGGGRAPGWASRFDEWYLPVNLFDTMYLCLRYNRR